jgi:parvulin-like peptidyl-prolyl isomerase
MSGCSKSSTDATSPTPNGTADSDVVATVNGTVISKGDMYTEMEQYVPAELQGFPQNPMLNMSAGRVQLQHLITNDLAIQLALSKGVPVTDDEVASRFDDVKMVNEAQSTKDFEDLLSDKGLTTGQYEEFNIKPDVAQFNIITKGLTASDQELQDYYNSHTVDFTEPNRVHIERIVLPDEAAAEQAYQTASKAGTLDPVIGQNIAPPMTTGDDAADIPQWIVLDGAPAGIKPLASALATATPGQILKPVSFQGHWWLIKIIQRRSKEIIPFDKVKHIVTWNVLSSKATQVGAVQQLQKDMQGVTQSATITVKPQQYLSLVKVLQTPPASGAQGQQNLPSQ